MGGKSSSKSSSSTTTTQIDERLAATDNASIIDIGSNSDVVLTDQGAIDSAGILALETINQFGAITMQALSQGESAVDVLSQRDQSFLDFADAQNRDDEQRTLENIMPWLIGGVSVLALTGAIKFRG